MIVSLRGTNSSGKTTVMRRLMEGFSCDPIYGMLGVRKPEAYQLLPKQRGAKSIYVLGPYDGTPTSGMDVVSKFGLEACTQLIEKYRQRGHVVMEGILLSSNFGIVGAYLEQHKEEVVLAIMDTPLEQCIADIKRRQLAAGTPNKDGTKHVAAHYKRIHGSTKKRFADKGIRVEMVSRQNAVERILSWLN